jgi:hypothetical protein
LTQITEPDKNLAKFDEHLHEHYEARDADDYRRAGGLRCLHGSQRDVPPHLATGSFLVETESARKWQAGVENQI